MSRFVKLIGLSSALLMAAASCTRSDLSPSIKRIPPPTFSGPPPGLYFVEIPGVAVQVPHGAVGVRYTIDASAPVTDEAAWFEHTASVPTLDRSTRLRAYAYGAGVNMSAIVVAEYRVSVAPVVASPPGGPFGAAVDVDLSCVTSGADIYYTLDGSDPTELSTLYTVPIHIDAPTVLKARAYLAPRDPSPVMTEAYGFGGPLRVALSYNLPRELSAVGLSLANETALGNVAHTANVSVTLNHSLPEAVASYRWYLNGEPLSTTAKSITIGPAGGVVTLLPGGKYELCGELIHGSYSYSYVSAFQAAPP